MALIPYQLPLGPENPSEQNIVNRESGGRAYVGYGGTDLSNAPLNQYGFPQWEGKMGPAGISHAAGLYQFEPKTWQEGAQALGVTDFSPESQKRVYDWTRAKYGATPWAASEPRLVRGGAIPNAMGRFGMANANLSEPPPGPPPGPPPDPTADLQEAQRRVQWAQAMQNSQGGGLAGQLSSLFNNQTMAVPQPQPAMQPGLPPGAPIPLSRRLNA